MSFASLSGNERNKAVLKRLLGNRNLGATLIFAGPSGIGKLQFALTFAKAANCIDPPESRDDCCDKCAVCERIRTGSYGDVVVLEPDGASIKIGQTRELIAEVQSMPLEGRQRFFIIDEADKLRGEAATSLLKTLEEPPPTSTVILITSRPDALMPTILSRAQRLNFQPLPVSEMVDYLRRNFPRPEADNVLLAHLTGGRIGLASAFDLSDYRRERQELIGLIGLLAAGKSRQRLIKAAEYYAKRERDDYERLLGLFAGLLRDMVLLASGAESVVNIDIADQLTTLAGGVGVKKLIGWAGKLDELQRNLRVNINRTIATEAALIEMAMN